jgi:flavin reductase (DIM6/NTAB) family NADH-FMN oxidoreductase RutF/rubredoxin
MELKALHKITYGMYVISSIKNERFNGQIANAVIQITSEPPNIAISINKQNLTHEFIMESRIFAISILSKETPMKFIGHFGFKSGREINKFKNVNYKIGTSGAPIILENSIGYLEAKVIHDLDVGTHTIFIGKIVDAGIINDSEPMTYAYYHEIKRGRAPKTAPTYIEEQEKEQKKDSTHKYAKYVCTVCGYVYDPEKGDPDSGIKPGTSFEEVPDDWVCPICGAYKSAFDKLD